MISTAKKVFFIIFAATVLIGVTVTAQEDLPAGSSSWKLVSFQCGFSLSDLRNETALGDAEILEWNGTEYVEPESIVKGRGYVVSAEADWSDDAICEDASISGSITHSKGWNIIGKTSDKDSWDFESEFADASIPDIVYSLVDGKYSEIQLSEYMNQNEGYWAYFSEDATLEWDEKKQKKEEKKEKEEEKNYEDVNLYLWMSARKVYTTDYYGAREIAVGEFTDFEVSISVYQNYNNEIYYDDYYYWDYEYYCYNCYYTWDNEYTGQYGTIEIISSNPDVLKIDENLEATALSAGTVEVYAMIGDYQSNSVEITVIDSECFDFSVYYEDPASGDSDESLLRDFKKRDDPNRSYSSGWDGWGWDDWWIEDWGWGWEDDWFWYDSMYYSGSITVVRSNWIKLNGAAGLEPNEFTAGERARLHAVCTYNTSLSDMTREKDVTDFTGLEVSSTALAQIDEENYLETLSEGSVELSVSLENVADTSFTLNIIPVSIEKLYLHAVTHMYGTMGEYSYDGALSYESGIRQATCTSDEPAYNCYFMQVGTSGTLALFAEYTDGSIRRIDSMVSWNVSDSDLVYMSGDTMLTASSAGVATVSASYGGLTSNLISVTVFSDKYLDFCDPDQPNTSAWFDEYTAWWDIAYSEDDAQSRATVSTDCATYTMGETVNMLYTAQLNNVLEPLMASVCLDLRIKDSAGNVVRTLKYEGCDLLEPMGRVTEIDHENFHVVYEHLGRWDMTDEYGDMVPPGTYTAFAQFNIIYEPIVTVDFVIVASDCGGYPPACSSNSDCDDGNLLTADTCSDAGTCESACSNTACDVACSAYAECDDGNPLTTDACVNGGTCDAVCTNTACDVACSANTDCDDGDVSTVDTCSGAGTCDAVCTFEAIPVPDVDCSIELDKVNYVAGDTMNITFTASNAGSAVGECGAETFLKRDKDTTVWFSFDDDVYISIPAGESVVETKSIVVPDEWIETDTPSGSDYGMEPVDRNGEDLGNGDNFNVKTK